MTTPISPVRRTCVPPQSSTEKVWLARRRRCLPIETTRTSSPYFSPNSARAPDSIASSTPISFVTTGSFCEKHRVGDVLDARELLVADRLWMAEVEAQAIGRDERALLRHVIAEHLAQGLVQKMRRGMVGADGGAARVIDVEFERMADLQRALLDRRRDARKGRRASSPCRSTRTRAPSARHDAACRRPGRRIRRRTASG